MPARRDHPPDDHWRAIASFIPAVTKLALLLFN